jgi:hypothetical protein
MWDCSLVDAARAFFNELPDDDRTEQVTVADAFVGRMADESSLKEALELLPKCTEHVALFLCTAIRSHCYRNPDAGDVIRPFLNNSDWRDRCAKQMSILGCGLFSQGLLALQTRGEINWAVEAPYYFLRMAEANADDSDRSTAFLVFTTISSAVGNTAGALKALLASEYFPQLRPSMKRVKDQIESLARVAGPVVRLRLQSILTVCEPI